MAIDYSEMRIGPPREVIEGITRRLGELNFSSANMKVGVSGSPCQERGALGGEKAWPFLKMLYLTHSLAQAQEMAGLLRAWDAKLFLDLEMCPEAFPQAARGQARLKRRGRRAAGRQPTSFFAFALIR